QPADQIEREKSKVPQAVFDVVSEHPEEERVAQNVAPASMEKHGYQWREDGYRVVVDDTGHPATERHRGADRSHVRQLARNQPKIADAGGESLLIEARALNEDPGHE